MPRLLSEKEVGRQLADLPDWSRTAVEPPSITAHFELLDFVAAMAFVNRIANEADDMNHHPDIDIRWNKVTLVLCTHSEGGLTQLDFELAHRISTLEP